MAGGNLFGRVLSYVVNEFIVEGLANSRAFQRFAVKTNKTLENLSSKAKEVREELSEQWRDSRGHDDVRVTSKVQNTSYIDHHIKSCGDAKGSALGISGVEADLQDFQASIKWLLTV